MRAVVSSSNPKDRGSSFWDGTLNRSNSIAKGKKNSPPPAIDQSFGSRDKIEGSFMDLKDDRKAGYHRSMGMRTASRLEKVSINLIKRWSGPYESNLQKQYS